MNEKHKLLSLPEEVFCKICGFLPVEDVLALSATCRYLRSTLDNNSVWRKYSDDIQDLSKGPCKVSPLFTHANIHFKPSSWHKLNFLNQRRLINNYRQAKFIKRSSFFKDHLPAMNEQNFGIQNESLHYNQITYSNEYLFSIGKKRKKDKLSEVHVYSISEMPRLLTSFKLVHITESNEQFAHLRVVGKVLVVYLRNFVDVYEITLPELTFPILNSINVEGYGFVFVLSQYLFGNEKTSREICVWDLHNGKNLTTMHPRRSGNRILSYSEHQRKILFFVGVDNFDEVDDIAPHLFLYDVDSLQYTSFDAVLRFTTFEITNRGIIGDSHIVLLTHSFGRPFNRNGVYVFDITTSALLAKNSLQISKNANKSVIFKEFLIFPTEFTVKFMNLMNLETVHELHIDCGGLIPELPQFCLENLKYIALSNQSYLLILFKSNERIEIWDSKTKKKCFDLPRPNQIRVNKTVTKLILTYNDEPDFYMKILTFW